MNELILIEYPGAFLCESKFVRKISHYTRDFENPNFCTTSDPNRFLERFCESRGLDFVVGDVIFTEVTHAIIFDDGEFGNLRLSLRAQAVRAKFIETPVTTVVNKDAGSRFDIYIGRGTPFGNPYPIGAAGDRAEVIRKYKYDFDRRLLDFFLDHDEKVAALRGKVLGCHCKPYACHGDVIAEYINSLDDGL